MLDAGRFIYGDDPGTGKTATTLRWLDASGPRHILIVAPANVIHHWEREAERWAPWLSTIDGRGTPKKREEARIRWHGSQQTALLLNYELLRQDIDYLLDMRWDAVVFDESHLLKNRQAQVHKAAVKIARRTPLLALVTGTPILNKADESWSSLHLIDPRKWSSYHRWAREHFHVEQTTFYGRVARPVTIVGDVLDGHEDLIADLVADHLIRRPIEELLPEMPDITETVLEVDLSSKERRVYDSLVKKMWADMDGSILKAKNAGVLTTRLRQLVSDWNGIEDMGAPGTKVRATAELVENLAPEQVVVLVSYKETAYKLYEALGGDDVETFTGDTAAVLRKPRLKGFADGDIRVLIGTHQALGTGVDGLQVARNIVLLDQDWTPAKNTQAIARIRRSGQTASKINVYKIVALDTIDQVVQSALEHKQSVIDAIVGRDPRDVAAGRTAA